MRTRQQDMVIAHVSEVEHLPSIVRKRQVSGLILIGHQPSAEVLKQIDDLPTVWLTSHHDVGGDVTLAGNEAVGRIAAEYLIQRGHKKLGVLNTLGQNPVLDVRCSYFSFVGQENGCTVSRYVSDKDSTWDGHQDLNLAGFEEQVQGQVDLFFTGRAAPDGPVCAIGSAGRHGVTACLTSVGFGRARIWKSSAATTRKLR